MPELVINVIGTPAPQGSHRAFVVNGRAVVTQDNKKTKPWRHDVATAAQEALTLINWGEPFIGPIELDVVFHMPRPGYHYGTGRNAGTLKTTAPRWCDKKPDVDKLLRSTCDALTAAGVYRDDSQVVRITAEQRYADAATGARITLTPLDQIEPTDSGSAVPRPTDSRPGPVPEGALF